MRTSKLVLSILAAAIAAPATVFAQATFTGLGALPGSTNCYATSLSADGLTASGYCSEVAGTNHAFRWRAGVMQDLGVPEGALYSQGGPMNSDGTVMVGLLGPTQRPGRWTEATGAIQDLGFPPGTNHIPLSVSPDGTVVWGFGGSSPVMPRVFRWTAATGLQHLALPAGYSASGGGRATPDGSVVVGVVTAGGPPRPVRWVGGVPMLLPLPTGVTEGDSAAVSANGLVIAGAMDSGSNRRIYRWTQVGGLQDLGGQGAVARDINADGSIIVGWEAPGGFLHAMLWSSATGRVDLNAHLSALGVDLSGWTLDVAYAISANGRTILGQGTHNGVQEAWIATLPGPCYANCDASTVAPQLNVNDFQCFINKYASQDPAANCDGSTNPPVLNVNDFQCFLNAYAAGCP